jgi:hypothetical protein
VNAAQPSSYAAAATGRDLRLDVFRGLAMCIILVAHIPGNPLINFIPARFGPSDATEMFVFCSGFASALAFGATFDRRGFAWGTVRILHRCWQIYWSHVAMFVTVAALCVAGTALSGGRDYVHALWLHPFFADPRQGLFHLVSLSYVPNYFDILPMYLVVLGMVPGVMALARLGPGPALTGCITLYLAQWLLRLDLPAEWWSDRPWFFDPFAWQLLFFTGFAFAAGWLPPVPRRRWLPWLAVAIVLVLVPLSWQPLWSSLAWLEQANRALLPWTDKTHFGPLRLLHFLALAYLALALTDRWPMLLTGPAARAMATVGQQALPVFLWSMCLAQVLGMVLDQVGRGPLDILTANVVGLASLVGVARLARLMKSQPWRQHGVRPAPAGASAARERHAPQWAVPEGFQAVAGYELRARG